MRGGRLGVSPFLERSGLVEVTQPGEGVGCERGLVVLDPLRQVLVRDCHRSDGEEGLQVGKEAYSWASETTGPLSEPSG